MVTFRLCRAPAHLISCHPGFRNPLECYTLCPPSWHYLTYSIRPFAATDAGQTLGLGLAVAAGVTRVVIDDQDMPNAKHVTGPVIELTFVDEAFVAAQGIIALLCFGSDDRIWAKLVPWAKTLKQKIRQLVYRTTFDLDFHRRIYPAEGAEEEQMVRSLS